jgi:hypothetical protein
VACGTFPVDALGNPVSGAALQASAFVTYLRTPNGDGRLTRVDLLGGAPPQLIDLGVSPSASSAYDGANTRLYVTSRFQTVGVAPLRWLELAAPGLGVSSVDLGVPVRGLEMRQLALSSDKPLTSSVGNTRRGYLAMRLYDEDLAITLGARPPADLAGALAVLDLADEPSGFPSLAIVNTVAVGRGANEVRVFPPRVNPADPGGAPLRDLVAVSSTDDSTVSLYDDATGSVSKIFDLCIGNPDPLAPGPCPEGRPELGKQPFGLSVEPFQRADILQGDGVTPVPLARLYVGSFDRSWVNVIEIDPFHPAKRDVGGVSLRWDRVGAERP